MLPLFFFVYAFLAPISSGSPLATPTRTASILPANGTLHFPLSHLSYSPDTCRDLEICRTRYNIISSSLLTILACVWTAVHRNIPAPAKRGESRVRRVVSRALDAVKIVAVTLLVPEWVLAWAIRQFLNARQVARRLEKARAEAKKRWDRKRVLQGMKSGAEEGNGRATPASSEEDTAASEEQTLIGDSPSDSTGDSEEKLDGEPSDESAMAIEKRAGRLDSEWTTQHGFFIIMGGFHYYDNGEPQHPLSRWDVVKLVRTGALVPPTEDEIRGWGQGDALSKTLAIVQTLWFVVQCIARRADGLPITQLEVMTLAYTTITVAMYAFWWSKPQNICNPVRVAIKNLPEPAQETREEPWLDRMFSMIGGWQDTLVDLRKVSGVPTFYGGNATDDPNEFYADVIALGAAMVFGVVHCVAWNYAFPSHAEKLIWRISSIAIIATPGALMLIISGIALNIEEAEHRILYPIFIIAAVLVFALSGPIYIAARMCLLALSFTTLRSLPYQAYQAVQWTLFIPHFS